MSTPDYSAFHTPQSNDALARLTVLAQQQKEAEDEVARAEAALIVAQQKLRDVQEVALPDLMEELGFKEFTTTTGLRIELNDKIFAAIPKERNAEAIRWLRDNNHAALVKHELKLSFGKGEDEAAARAQEMLRSAGYQYDDKETVHTSTLSAFVRQSLKAGKDLPSDLLGINRKRVTQIK